jgi:hypothetical protein
MSSECLFIYLSFSLFKLIFGSYWIVNGSRMDQEWIKISLKKTHKYHNDTNLIFFPIRARVNPTPLLIVIR